MANEFVHVTVGTSISQTEYEANGAHLFNSQATGDIMVATSATQLSRLAVGAANAVLVSDGTDPSWDTSPTFVADVTLNDDVDLALGTSADILVRNRSTSAAADLEITDIIVGTSVHPGVAANSLIVSNITASGDMLFLTNRGANSEAHMLFDASAGDTFFYARGVQQLKLTGGGSSVFAGAVDVSSGTVTGPSGTWDSGGMDIATSDSYAIAGTDVLVAATLGTGVLASSLTSVGALNAGSITSGFTSIDVGDGAITTTGVITGGTVEATTDTASDDNAAMGYTTTEGLILTGQGSSFDVVVKNDADGNVLTVATGTTVVTFPGTVDVTGGQIVFPGTQAASSGANTLDDFEEGTFIPGLTDNSGDGTGEGQVYTTAVGEYQKIGKWCYYSLRILCSDLGTLTTSHQAQIDGLPFTAGATTSSESAVHVGFGDSLGVTAIEQVAGTKSVSNDQIKLNLWDATTGTSLCLISDLTVGLELIMSGHYETGG